MTLAAAFLGGAKSRLLPPFVPFQFFGAAAALHVALWATLLLAAADFPRFLGGVGPTLAAVHLLTLGVLTTTAIGAAAQLLPVATRRALAAVWPINAVFWLLVPGLLALVAGMYEGWIGVLIAGAATSTAALLLFAFLFADNLRRAGSLPVIAAYGWAAFASLVLLVALGVALSVDYEAGVLPDHAAAALAHMVLGSFGFMGMLALGFSHVLVPMFALASAPDKRLSWIGFGLAAASVLTGALGALAGSAAALNGACALGVAAVAVHLRLMHVALSTGMRKRLGLSFVLIRVAWALLGATPLIGLLALHGLAGPNGGALFGLVALGGWLMTFLFGILQRIMPFLASMHVTKAAGGPPLLSDLGGGATLAVHAACHLAAVAGLAAAIVLDSGLAAGLAAGIGLIGALAFGAFTLGVVRRLASGRA